MLIDASVARSFAVIGWARHLLALTDGTILIADGVHGQRPGDPSELRGIRAALQRRVEHEPLGSGVASRVLAAIHGLDELLSLTAPELMVLTLTHEELELAIRLQSRRTEDRACGTRSERSHGGLTRVNRRPSPSRLPGRFPSPATTKMPSPSGRHQPAHPDTARETCSGDSSETVASPRKTPGPCTTSSRPTNCTALAGHPGRHQPTVPTLSRTWHAETASDALDRELSIVRKLAHPAQA